MSLRNPLKAFSFTTRSIATRLTLIFTVIFGLLFSFCGFILFRLVFIEIPVGRPPSLGEIFFFISASTTLVAGVSFLCWKLSRNALLPLNEMINAVDRITGQNLSARFELSTPDKDLQRLVGALNDMLGRLEDSFRIQEEFLGHASHELKTPLAIIKGELDVLRQKNRTPEQIEQFFTSASEELTHLGRLVANLLLLTRIQSGQQTYDGTVTELEDVIMNELPLLDRLGKNHGVRISMNMTGLDEALLSQSNRVKGEPELLGCMISNIVENAIKYSSTPSVITIHCDFRPTRYVEFSVKDSGTGISAENLPQIFDRFYRTPDANDRVHGTGLGLALVQQIARLYQCHLNVSSSPGIGTTFLIQFPKSS